jgi:hypothetical protein
MVEAARLASLVHEVIDEIKPRNYTGGLPPDALDTEGERVYKHALAQHKDWLANRAALSTEGKLPPEADPDNRTPEQAADDALAHYVFNVLRGHHDDIDGTTYDEVWRVVVSR